jgi:hypothetical protein
MIINLDNSKINKYIFLRIICIAWIGKKIKKTEKNGKRESVNTVALGDRI